jgi:hypothetical protein
MMDDMSAEEIMARTIACKREEVRTPEEIKFLEDYADKHFKHPSERWPDFESARGCIDCMSAHGYAQYLWNFRLNHPIMYHLWYKWWFMRFLSPQEKRSVLFHLRNCRGEYCYSWASYAMLYPVLFFLWLLLTIVF